ncbi:hypothetical protein JXQ31_03110 [candidate division KSB1 bacterium]|nr:hypothetical protein [candidate division KSB1 bacterium]
MKMKKYGIVLIVLISLILSFYCKDDKKTVTGHKNIEELTSSVPAILADGLATANIIAVVYDTSGYVKNAKVNFSTTKGSITKSAFTNDFGEAVAVITSQASEQDINVTITATLSDDQDLMKKNTTNRNLVLYFGKNYLPKKLAKKNQITQNSSNISMIFLGVSVDYKLDKTELPADGISTALLSFNIKESTSKMAVGNAKIHLKAAYTTVAEELLTDEKGQASTNITSVKQSVTDTIFIEYGNKLSYKITITYMTPQIDLLPDSAKVKADGSSKLNLTARLFSHNNHPIAAAEIHFTSSDGIITEAAATNEEGEAKAVLLSSKNINPDVKVIAKFGEIADTSHIAFVESLTPPLGKLLLLDFEKQVYRNGIEQVPVTATLVDEQYQPLVNRAVYFSIVNGTIDSVARTNEDGQANVIYTPDAGETDLTDFITARFDTIETTKQITLLGVLLEVDANPSTIPGDGITTSTVTALLKLSTTLVAIPDANITFSTNLGIITNSSPTDEYGVATALFSSKTSGTANITIRYGRITRTLSVEVSPEIPNSIVLTADPKFIWVKETGNLEQTIVTAQVLTQTGKPINSNVNVIFTIRNSPGGGEFLEPAVTGSTTESIPIQTVDGEAKIKLRSGIRPGTVEMEAKLEDYDISARMTNLVIRSGPAYIYIDPADPNTVDGHMSIAFDYLNLPGWMLLTDFKLTVSVGDKYNNPVDQGTTVYLRTTGGIVTTDTETDEKGISNATLITGHPLPYVSSDDPNAMNPHHILNPNANNLEIPITIPDFEGDGNENDGIAYVMARTHGRDQNGNDAEVWRIGFVVFSGPLNVFTVTTDRTSLNIGQVATLTIRIWDINGNPVAAGSELTAETTHGKLSATDLMPEKENYGLGSTIYQVQLTNDLKPEDQSKTAIVNIKLDSPNGSTSRSVIIFLNV